jgi:hypothetical protein
MDKVNIMIHSANEMDFAYSSAFTTVRSRFLEAVTNLKANTASNNINRAGKFLLR